MQVSVQHWDAFTRTPGKGNPAGIVLTTQTVSESQMQAIALTIGFNDTAFVVGSHVADLRLRYFAPLREVDLCGHATIAAFVALHAAARLAANRTGFTLETRSGILPIEVIGDSNGPRIIMTQARSQFAPFDGDRGAVARSLGISERDFHDTLPIQFGSTGRWTLVVPIKSLEAMKRMRPAPELFAGVLTDKPGASIHPFCLQTIDPDAHLHARHFSSPASGTLEDAVTGTASGVLGAYYRQFIDLRRQPPFLIEQGFEVDRDGRVQVWAEPDGDRFAVRIAGSACFVRDILVDI